jgi:hypothetical protein
MRLSLKGQGFLPGLASVQPSFPSIIDKAPNSIPFDVTYPHS